MFHWKSLILFITLAGVGIATIVAMVVFARRAPSRDNDPAFATTIGAPCERFFTPEESLNWERTKKFNAPSAKQMSGATCQQMAAMLDTMGGSVDDHSLHFANPMGSLLLFGAVVFYFLPGIVALGREHHNAGAIVALDLLTGLSVVGWIIAFVWACTAVRKLPL